MFHCSSLTPNLTFCVQVKQQLVTLQHVAASIEHVKQQLEAQNEQVHRLEQENQHLQMRSCNTEQQLEDADAAKGELQLQLKQATQTYNLDLQHHRYAMHSQQCSLSLVAGSHQVLLPAKNAGVNMLSSTC